MKKHVDLSSEDPEQICKSILEDVINDIHNKDETSMYRKKSKVNDLHSDKLDDSHKPLNVGVDKMELENSIVNHDHEYEQKFELGKAVHEIVIKRWVRQQSLRPERKVALDMYMKESVESFPANVELKPS